MADSEGVLHTEPIPQPGNDAEEEEEEEEEGEEEEGMKRLSFLMDRLRHKDKSGSYKSWLDGSKGLKHFTMEKRHQPDAEDKDLIQKEITLLTQAVKVSSLSNLIDHLDQISKKAGLSVVTATGANRVILKSEMFEVNVTLESSGKVKDVSISHDGITHNRDSQSSEDLSRQELTQLICEHKYEGFSKHIQGLVSMFNIPGDKSQKTKAFIALQSLETDLNMLSKMQSTISSVANYIHKSPLGILKPRIGGVPMQMTYFVGPYDLLCPQTRSFCPMTVEAILEKKVGERVSVGLRSSTPHTLQTMPLIMDGKSVPSFSALNKINSCSLPAVFVLRLHEAIPLSWALVQKITDTTGVDFVDQTKLKSLMTLLIEHVRKKDLLDSASQHGLHVHLPDQRHSYYLHHWPDGVDYAAAMVTEIPFTHPTHVAAILSFLRQQVLFNTLVASCIRNATPHNGESCWTFELVPSSLTSLSISFEHPCNDSIATVEVDLADVTAVKCRISTSAATSGDSPQESFCSEDSATKVLQRCLSLPVMLRWILHQALAHIQQKTIASPRSVDTPTMDNHCSGIPAGISRLGLERRQAFKDAHLRNQLPWKHMNNVMRRFSSGLSVVRSLESAAQVNLPAPAPLPPVAMDIVDSTPDPPPYESYVPALPSMDSVDDQDKVAKNPMLASLLGQDSKSPQSVGVVVNNLGDVSPSSSSHSGGGANTRHSVLSALLDDSESPASSQNQQVSPFTNNNANPTAQPQPPHHPSKQQHLHQQQQMHLIQQQQQQQHQHLQHQPPHHPPPHHNFQQPHVPPPSAQYPPPFPQNLQQPHPQQQKKPRKRKSIGSDPTSTGLPGRPPKRKPSEDDLRAIFNVDGSSLEPPVSMKAGPPVLGSTIDGAKIGLITATPAVLNPACVAGPTTPTSVVTPRLVSSASHVNRLASSMDGIIKQEAGALLPPLPPPPVPPARRTPTPTLPAVSPVQKVFPETVLSGESSEDSSQSSAGSSSRSSDGLLTNSKLSLKTLIKTEKQDPFDFTSSLPKDPGPDNTGGKVLKLEPKLEGFTKDLSNDKSLLSFEKADSAETKPDGIVRYKERKKDKREVKDSEDRVDKEKPLAITMKLNTRDFTARTIIKESPVRSASPQDTELWREKAKDAKTIDLTGDMDSDKSSSSSTPSHGRTTPGSTPNTSPRILQGSLKRPNKDKQRGEKRRRSSKHNSDDADKRHRKAHNSDDVRKEQLNKKQRIYDFDGDNDTDNYRVEKLAKPTTIKIRTNKIAHNSALKNSPISLSPGGRSPNTISKTGVASPLKKSLENNKLSVQKQRLSAANVARTYSRSKSENQINTSGNTGNVTPTSTADKVDTKLYKNPQIKLKPLNITSSAAVTVSSVTTATSTTTKTPSSAPVTTSNKPNVTPSANAGGTGPVISSGPPPKTTSNTTTTTSKTTTSSTNSTSSAPKSTKAVPAKSKKLGAIIDKLKKQQTSPSDGRDSEPVSGKDQAAIYEALRIQIIREGCKPSNPTKDVLTTTLKSSHFKKDSSTKETFKNKTGAMPPVNPSTLGTIPKTSSSQANRQTNSSTTGGNNSSSSTSSSGGGSNANSSSGTATAKPSQPSYSQNSSTNLHKPQPTPEHKPPADQTNNKKDSNAMASSIIASKDPRMAAHLNNKRPPTPPVPKKPPLLPTPLPPPQPATTNNSNSKLDDLTEKQKNARHFLDAVKLPVNGSPGPEADGRVTPSVEGDEPPKKVSEHPNHEIFTEAPSSPTEDMDNDGPASPSPERFNATIQSPDPVEEEEEEENILPNDLSEKDRPMDVDRWPDKDVVTTPVDTNSNKPWANKTTFDKERSQSPLCNSSSDKTGNKTSGSSSSNPTHLGSSEPPTDKKPVKVLPVDLSPPSSPVSSPEDGLVIDCSGSPKSSPVKALIGSSSSPCVKPSPHRTTPTLPTPTSKALVNNSSPGHSPSPASPLATSPLKTVQHNSTSSPLVPSNSASPRSLDIDDDLMDAALVL